MTRRWLLLGGMLLMLAAAGASWWWLRPAPLEPPTPPGVEDTEVLQAILDAQQPVRDAPGSAAAWGHLGKVLLAQQFDKEADVCFAEAFRLAPTDARWLYPRCVIILKRDPDHAVAMLREALAIADKAPADYRSVIGMQLAEALLERGQLDEAEKLYNAEHGIAPDNPRATLGLGLIAQLRGENALATAMLTAAQSGLSARRYATVQLAALARAQGDSDLADVYERKIATLPPDAVWPDPFFEEIAPMQVGQRGFEREVKRLEKERRFDEAAELYLKRIAAHPTLHNYAGAAVNLGRQRDYDRAFPLLREAVRLYPNHAHAHYTLALVVFARAEREWQTRPDAPEVKAWFGEARDHAKKAAELRPSYGEAYLFWGMSQKYLGQPEAAIAPLRSGVALLPADGRLQLGLGQALLEAGHGAEAAIHLENARRIAPDDPRPIQALDRIRKKDNNPPKG
jgi:tetratricopeptide (TPR) repeat protein